MNAASTGETELRHLVCSCVSSERNRPTLQRRLLLSDGRVTAELAPNLVGFANIAHHQTDETATSRRE